MNRRALFLSAGASLLTACANPVRRRDSERPCDPRLDQATFWKDNCDEGRSLDVPEPPEKPEKPEPPEPPEEEWDHWDGKEDWIGGVHGPEGSSPDHQNGKGGKRR